MEMWTEKPINWLANLSPTAHKVVISRDVIFAEDKMQMEENNSILKETTEVQMENT
jgi:hypothetical protein